MPSVPFILVTGFLGSGKTTFLKNFARHYSGTKKLGIIQNEFSSVNIDGEELRQTGESYEILEINNGSVFCVCLLGDFISSLSNFIDEYKPDEVILEASGISDPISIAQVLHSSKLKNKIYLDYIWSIVDVPNFEKIAGFHTRVVHQLRIADTIILNKIDLAPQNVETISNKVAKINPMAKIVEATYCETDFEKIKVPFKILAEGKPGIRPQIESLIIKTTKTISFEYLELFIKEIKNDFIRMKGYVNIEGHKKVMLQGSYKNYRFFEVDNFISPTEIVGIGNLKDAERYVKLYESFCLK
jgi:G3E family GTPase